MQASSGTETGFHHCVPPYQPPCMGQDETFQTKQATAVCEPEVRIFTNSLAIYRTCLLQESQRAVVHGNDAISAFRCRAGERDRCQ